VTDVSDPQDTPALVVLHGGEPDAHELAALVVALGTVTGGPQAQRPSDSKWADRRALLRKPLDHGPGRWVASARRPADRAP
jgi:Acyl-CoA carboxylase epsilon subunit